MGILTKADGEVARNPEEAEQLRMAGYIKCFTEKIMQSGPRYGRSCPFFISPEGQAHIQNQMGGYYTCPYCQQSHDLLHELPWHGVQGDEAEENMRADQGQMGYQSGGGTRIGLSMSDQAEIGENLVEHMGTLGNYGPIVWWHGGGATGASPLDGATRDWGVEVKTLGYDATHHRFVPGGKRKRADGSFLDEKGDKNAMAQEMGKKGVLGVLVMLDYRRSVADVYAREFPLEKGGVKAFRSHQGQRLLAEVPFENPLMNPEHPAPHSSSAFSTQNQPDMPF